MFAHFIDALPRLELPFAESVVSARGMRSDRGLAAFFTFHADVELPEHSHGPQWGTLVAGRVTMTIDGHTRVMRPGDTWDIPGGVPHSAQIAAGSVVIDVFAEPDRYLLRD